MGQTSSIPEPHIAKRVRFPGATTDPRSMRFLSDNPAGLETQQLRQKKIIANSVTILRDVFNSVVIL